MWVGLCGWCRTVKGGLNKDTQTARSHEGSRCIMAISTGLFFVTKMFISIKSRFHWSNISVKPCFIWKKVEPYRKTAFQRSSNSILMLLWFLKTTSAEPSNPDFYFLLYGTIYQHRCYWLFWNSILVNLMKKRIKHKKPSWGSFEEPALLVLWCLLLTFYQKAVNRRRPSYLQQLLLVFYQLFILNVSLCGSVIFWISFRCSFHSNTWWSHDFTRSRSQAFRHIAGQAFHS